MYPDLDLSPLDTFKVVKGEVLVDEEAKTSPRLEPFPSPEEGVVREGDNPGSLRVEHTVMEEEVPEE